MPCDVFVTEATFGLPVFRHPPPATRSPGCCDACALFPERTHVVGGYALGKASGVIALLREAGWDGPIYLHGALVALCALYEAQGIALGALAPATGGRQGRAAPARSCWRRPPPSPDRWARRLPDPVVARGLAAGCGCGSGRKPRGVELPLVISDHADWDELNAHHRRGRRAARSG